MTTDIWIRTSFVGFHCWPDAPEQVSYLRLLHRHKFNVRVQVSVEHSNRAVEFHTLQKVVNKLIEQSLVLRLQVDHSMSCEMMAEYLADRLSDDYRVTMIEVDEDGENGAILYPMG